jgi:ABC-type lipoprotein export system ATPase subunit
MPLTYASQDLSGREARRRASEMLDRVGLSDRKTHEPSQLSGGQQQRVAIARALINSPQILFADEPTGNLDSRTSEEVLTMFEKLNSEDHITIILVTHDAGVARHARRVIRIHDGVIADGAPGETAPPRQDPADNAGPPRPRGNGNSRGSVQGAEAAKGGAS